MFLKILSLFHITKKLYIKFAGLYMDVNNGKKIRLYEDICKTMYSKNDEFLAGVKLLFLAREMLLLLSISWCYVELFPR